MLCQHTSLHAGYSVCVTKEACLHTISIPGTSISYAALSCRSPPGTASTASHPFLYSELCVAVVRVKQCVVEFLHFDISRF